MRSKTGKEGFDSKSDFMNRLIVKIVLFFTVMVIASLFYQFVPDIKDAHDEFRLRKEKTDPAFLSSPSGWVDSVMNSLTPDERIAQMIMVAAYSNNNKKNEEDVKKLVQDYKVGGIIFFQGSPYRQAELTNLYQSLAKTPLFVAMDAEWGLSMRLDSTIRYPRQMMLGAIKNERLIFDMGEQIARQLTRIGVQINFAPVVDVNNNPKNPIINSRSFGEDRANVTRKALFYMIGMEENGILPVAKHFPGHGDTESDSHLELPVIRFDRNRLDSVELFPYKELIYSGLPGIMTAHLQIPALDPGRKMPSSLSELVIDSLLKHDMGFKGLIFTDALNMKGITDNFKPDVAVEKAVLAGNDILLMPENIPDVIDKISKLIKRGKITQEEIDSRCRKILMAKYWSGLDKYKPVKLTNLYQDLNKPEYLMLQQKLIESSLTTLSNRSNIIPLRHLDTLKIASLVFSDTKDTVFQLTLGLYMTVKQCYIRGDGLDNLDSIFNAIKDCNLIIASLHSNDMRAERQFGITDCMIGIIDSLAATRNVILDVLANPYILDRFNNLSKLLSLVVSYENSPLVQSLSAQMLFGAIGSDGLLPVSASSWLPLSSGIEVQGLGRLKYTMPYEAGMSADTLTGIDKIVADAIDTQAMPGCQILVARNGMIIYNKAFGNPVYNSKQHVTSNDIYDLASVTKISATLPCIMKLTDDGCLDINQKLSSYMQYLLKTNKKDIYIKDLLLHQAGLVPWIPFYLSTLEPVFKGQVLMSNTISDANPIKLGPNQYLNRYTRYKSGTFSRNYSPEYSIKVADKLYLKNNWRDSIYLSIAKSPLSGKREYKYSDLGFILLRELVDSLTGKPFDSYVDSLFYRKLGAGHICFNPLNKFPVNEIMPTEDDQVFRKQQIRGYVHDPAAAMLGGISGHAGLFSNANDLAKLLQMYLNHGEYAGEQYISKETIDLFTSRYSTDYGNRRGLGFDKPEPDATKPGPVCADASLQSYGHTGFTGNMVWVDPKYNLIYIFLSNRVYPDASNEKLVEMNVRTNIQHVIYQAISGR